MQRLEVSGAVRPLYGSLGVKGLSMPMCNVCQCDASQHCDIRVAAVRLFPVWLFPFVCPLPLVPTLCLMQSVRVVSGVISSQWRYGGCRKYDEVGPSSQQSMWTPVRDKQYSGLINCRTQLICGTYMFITDVSTTCFGAYGHLQIDELTKIHKQLYLACVFYTVEGGFLLLDGGTRSRVYWVGRGVYMGVYYANLSFVPYKRRMPNVTAYVFLSIHQPEDGHKRRNM
jgi:hypothetical protein